MALICIASSLAQFFITQGSFTAPVTWQLKTLCYRLFILNVFAALAGTTLDSILGAIFENSYYCHLKRKIVSKKSMTTTRVSGTDLMTGSNVNYVSGIIVGIATGILAQYL